MAKARTTADDVARAAGVSRATVSYVLNNDPRQTISPATRAKVEQAAVELNYTPLASARSLSRGRSDVVVMLMPDRPLGSVIPAIMDTLADRLAPHGLELVLHRCRPDRSVRRLWSAITPAAVIRMGSLGASDDESLRRAQIGYLLELADTEAETGHPLFPSRQIGQTQGDHLIGRGHRRLGYAWPADERVRTFAEARLAGVRSAAGRAGLAAPEVIVVSPDRDVALDAVRRWTAAGTTAVASYNDELALALLDAARRDAIEVPRRLAVVGVDNLPWGAYAEPSLTTVAPRAAAIAEFISESIWAGISGAEPPPLPDKLVQLVIRHST